MVSIPLEWTITLKGGERVKTTLADLESGFSGVERGTQGYNKALSQGNREALRGINVNRYRNNILLAEHPNLLRVSRAMSTVTSISRTLLTISNALNLSKIANQGLDANTIAINNDVAVAKRKLIELEKEGKNGTDEWYKAVEALNLAMGKQKENSQAIIDQKWDGLATGVEGALLAVSSTFSLLIKNGAILKALTAAGSYFGGIFSGFFVLASKAITGIAAVITNTLGITSPVNKAAIITGTETGAGFGAGFLAGVAGTVTGIALGVILFPTIDKALKDAFPFYKTFAKERDKISNDNANMIFGKDSDFKKGAQSIAPGFFGNGLGGTSPNTGGFIGPMKPSSSSNTVNDSVSKSLKESFTPLVTSMDKTDINFKNLNTGLITNSTNTLEANKILLDYANYVKEFNPADKSAREDMKNKTVDLKNMLSNNSTNIGLNVLSTNLLTSSNSTLTDTINSLSSSLKSGGGGAGGGMSSSSNVYANPWGLNTTPSKSGKKATGFEGMVNTPSLMMVGDAGPEYVSVTPHGGTRSGGGNMTIVNVYGSIWNERQLFSRLDDIQKNNLKRRGFTGT